MMSEPILLTFEEAKKYLGGADPEKVSPPIRLGRRKFWSRHALDCQVKKLAGLEPATEGAAGNAYDAWKNGCA